MKWKNVSLFFIYLQKPVLGLKKIEDIYYTICGDDELRIAARVPKDAAQQFTSHTQCTWLRDTSTSRGYCDWVTQIDGIQFRILEAELLSTQPTEVIFDKPVTHFTNDEKQN